MKDINGVCLSCLNKERKSKIKWEERQKWLTEHIVDRTDDKSKWDCVVGVSGGKDSCTIVKRLIEFHGIKNPLLVHVCDEFTPSEAGKHNLDNLVKTYNVDLLSFRFAPETLINETRRAFFEELNPLKWLESKLYQTPLDVAHNFGIPLVFMGENSAFEYGEAEECDIFHPASDDVTEVIYMGAIWPYSTQDSLNEAKMMGFKTLEDYDDWNRQGCGDNYSQIDSKGYMVHLWLKFIKFGFQRVTDLACRHVREGAISKEQAMQMIKDYDWMCDPLARKDFCRSNRITEEDFFSTIDKFANRDLLIKDSNGNWRRKDLI